MSALKTQALILQTARAALIVPGERATKALAGAQERRSRSNVRTACRVLPKQTTSLCLETRGKSVRAARVTSCAVSPRRVPKPRAGWSARSTPRRPPGRKARHTRPAPTPRTRPACPTPTSHRNQSRALAYVTPRVRALRAVAIALDLARRRLGARQKAIA